ncbi:MAG: BolA family protein [Microcystaceae cyanobacterium]
MTNFDEYAQMIKASLPDAQVFINDLTGGGDHLEAVVISSKFAGQNKVKQHQMVYGALQEHLASEAIHALALKTYTPETWATVAQT